MRLKRAGSDDKVWMDVLLSIPTHLLKFQVRSLMDVLPTNANLFQWKKRTTDQCNHCHWRATTAHVLNNCTPNLPKYRWRHDSVLKQIANFCYKHRVEETEMYVDLAAKEHPAAMGGAPPPHLLLTEQRPDLLLGNTRQNQLAILELTIPSEHNATDAKIRKTVKYLDLVAQARESGRSVLFFTLEICSRGIIPNANLSRAMSALKTAGILSFSRVQLHELLEICARTALAGSYWVWTSRSSTYVPPHQPLLWIWCCFYCLLSLAQIVCICVQLFLLSTSLYVSSRKEKEREREKKEKMNIPFI